MAWFERGPNEKDPENKPQNSARVVEMTPDAPKNREAAVSPPPKPLAVAPVEPGVVGHLFKGSRVSGQLMFQGPAKIEGSVEGEIQCHGTLTIGEGADVRAKITSQVLVVRGRVEGGLTARDKVELLAPARVAGNINTPRLIITEGAIFDGDCSMGVAKQKSGVASSQAVSAEKAATVSKPPQQSDSKN